MKTDLPRIISGSDFDREFMQQHEQAYIEVLQFGREIYNAYLLRGMSKKEAVNKVQEYIEAHPLFNPLAAIEFGER